MTAAFDDSAATYDEDFTNTSIGRLQRNKVWDYLLKTFQSSFPSNILELNCGTGEDAVFFAEHGSKVLATDISLEMLNTATKKFQQKNFLQSITTKQLDLENISADIFNEKYDLIFSNFGGFNCISPQQTEKLLAAFSKILPAKGRIILIIMPRFCFWESLYFSYKLNFKKAFRRRSVKPQLASLGYSKVNTWYHSPAVLKKIAEKYYDIKNIQPIGISLPPSYLQKTFLTRNKILNKLDALENKLNRFSIFSSMADHYLIDLELR